MSFIVNKLYVEAKFLTKMFFSGELLYAGII